MPLAAALPDMAALLDVEESDRTMSHPANPARLEPPRPAGRLVPREHLLARMFEARRGRCIALHGPAGYGKTSLLSAWRGELATVGYDVAWLTLGAEHNDPTVLLDDVIGSLMQVSPDIGEEAALLAGRGVDEEGIEACIVALVRRIAKRPRELMLVLDDMHRLREPLVIRALQWLVDYAPGNLHFALSSRTPLPVSLARPRAQGLLLELDLRDLRFTQPEAEQLLRAQIGDLSARDAALLYEMTDGWVAGLQLLAIAWRKRRPRSRAGAGALHLHDAAAFASFFNEHVLAGLGQLDRRLLVALSACTRFCAPLGAAMIGEPAAVSDVIALLERLHGDNLFIVPVETQDGAVWYRLHPLLQRTLQVEFDQQDADTRRSVHARAWRWLQDHGQFEECVRHAVRAGEAEEAAALVERWAHTLAARGEVRKIVRLVRQLPEQSTRHRFGLRLWMLRTRLFAGELDACDQGIAELARQLPPECVNEAFALTLLQAFVAVQRDDLEAALALLPRLLEEPPGADATLRGGRTNILSWLYMNRGEFDRARRVQVEGPPRIIDGMPLLGTPAGILSGRCLVGLSHALEGEVAQAERVYREVLGEAESRGSACAEAGAMAAALLGEVLYELNDHEAALRLLEERVEVLEKVSMPDSVLRVLTVLADAHALAGRELESQEYAERLEDYAVRFKLDRLLGHSLVRQLARQLRIGGFDAAQALLARIDALAQRHAPNDRDDIDEVGLVALRARIGWLTSRGEFAPAAGLLDTLLKRCEGRRWQRFLPPLHLQAAVVRSQLGQDIAADDFLADALRIGHKLGLVRSLLDVDPGALALIQRYREQPGAEPVLAFYAERLAAAEATVAQRRGDAVPQVVSAATKASVRDVMSDRELEVVRLLGHALPNKKIARSLGLSPETVKWHLKNIYGKLGVTGRDEAVARIRDAGLLH